MIQRIQTIFLILAAVCFGALFKLPLATGNPAGSLFFADSVYNILDHPVLSGVTIAGAITALITIFFFKNRKLQTNLVYVFIVLGVIIPVAAFLLLSMKSPIADSAMVHYQSGLILPLGAIVFGFLAGYFIRKDERLVKSMDRLR